MKRAGLLGELQGLGELKGVNGRPRKTVKLQPKLLPKRPQSHRPCTVRNHGWQQLITPHHTFSGSFWQCLATSLIFVHLCPTNSRLALYMLRPHSLRRLRSWSIPQTSSFSLPPYHFFILSFSFQDNKLIPVLCQSSPHSSSSPTLHFL